MSHHNEPTQATELRERGEMYAFAAIGMGIFSALTWILLFKSYNEFEQFNHDTLTWGAFAFITTLITVALGTLTVIAKLLRLQYRDENDSPKTN